MRKQWGAVTPQEKRSIRERVEKQNETIVIEPNFDALFDNFSRDADIHLEKLVTLDAIERADVYRFIASLRVAVGCMTKNAQILKLREMLNERGSRMFEVLEREREQREEQENG